MDTYNPNKLTASLKKVDINLRQLADIDITGGDRDRVDNIQNNQILVSLSKFNRPKTFSFHYISDLIKGGTGITVSTDKDGIASIINTGVTKIIAGTNITISPTTGIGDVTINAANGGITSLNSLTAAAQTFVNDTNISIVSSGTTHTLTWLGTLADSRIASASTWNGKQDALVSGTNIKTINSTSVLGSGDIAVQPTLVSGTNIKTINSTSLLGSGNITVGTFTLPSLTSGSVLFSDGTTIAQDNTAFNWDNTNKRLNLVSSGDNLLNLTPQASGNAIVCNNNSYIKWGTIGYIRGFSTATTFAVYNSAFTNIFNIGTTSACYVNTGSNFLIGTTTDAGFKLDVNGTARVSGDTIIQGSSALSNANGFLVRNSSAVHGLSVTNNAEVKIGRNQLFGFFDTSTGGYTFNITATNSGVSISNSAAASRPVSFSMNTGEILRIHQSYTAIVTNNFLVGTTTDVASSKLTVESTTQGFLPPRMTTTQKNAIASPASGLWVYDNTLNASNYYNGTTWVDRGSNIEAGKKVLSFFTDFLSNAALDGLQTFASGGSGGLIGGTLIPNRTNQQGVSSLSTGAVATNYIFYCGGSASPQIWFGGGAWNYETSINIQTLSTITDRFRLIFGFGSGTTSSTETDGVFLTYDEGGTANGTAASANWQCVTVQSSIRTLTTTTTAVTAAAWLKLRIEINAAATSVAFYVNGTLIATHTTNIPVPNRYVLVKHGIAKAIGTNSISLFNDYIGYENILTTPR